VQQLHIQMEHCGREATSLEIVLREPCASADYFLELLHLQLDRQMLPAPVTGLCLQAALIPAAAVSNTAKPGLLTGNLLPGMKAGDGSHTQIHHLIERLQARLGTGQVYGLKRLADHRPECAWAIAEASVSDCSQAVPGQMVSRVRPLWLLAVPRRLETRHGKPLYRGALEFISDAERIESGWWDGNDIRRDYYAVTSRVGSRLWIYQDCRDSGWYLHGLFG